MSKGTRKGPQPVARPRCAILARVSTGEQHLDAQVPMLRAEAERRAFDVVEVVEDVGSGRKMDERAGLRRVLALADEGAIDVLLVAELSRVGRSVVGLARVVEQLRRRGVSLVSVREAIDLTTPAGRMFVHILAAVAQFEAECLAERTSHGIRAAAARGAAVGKAPFGTRWEFLPSEHDGATRSARLAAVPDEIVTLRRAVTIRATGAKWYAVANALNTECRFNREGLAWLRDKLARAVQNARVQPFLEVSERPAAAVSAVSA